MPVPDTVTVNVSLPPEGESVNVWPLIDCTVPVLVLLPLSQPVSAKTNPNVSARANIPKTINLFFFLKKLLCV
ncbi:MAG: hypothetical protein LBB83_10760 [Treponema sp.]|jgi:hypothetical protein|nr:hypothetical protein [Treponema sp.]